MDAGASDNAPDKSAASAARKRQSDARASKLIECPFEVRIDGAPHDQFYDLRDAMASARAAKRSSSTSTVVVSDARTGKLVAKVED